MKIIEIPPNWNFTRPFSLDHGYITFRVNTTSDLFSACIMGSKGLQILQAGDAVNGHFQTWCGLDLNNNRTTGTTFLNSTEAHSNTKALVGKLALVIFNQNNFTLEVEYYLEVKAYLLPSQIAAITVVFVLLATCCVGGMFLALRKYKQHKKTNQVRLERYNVKLLADYDE